MDHHLTRRTFLKTTTAGALALGAELLSDDAEAAARPLPRRVLGKTGVRVPILGFGTASCGIRRNVPNAVELYNEAIDLGVNYMDTAPSNTGYGRAQVQLGHVLKDRRDDVFLVTKTHEAGGDAALRLLEKNLKELQTDHADLVYVHSLGDLDLDTALGPRGVFAALMKAKREGLTRFVGVSGHHRPAKFLRALKAYDIDVLMCAVNFADRHTYNFEQKVFPVAAQKNVGLVAMKVYGGANWSDKTMSNRMMPKEYLPAAFRYALSIPRVSLAVVGMATREELMQNLAWARRFRPLSDAERQSLAPVGRKLAARWGAHFGPVG
uniref:NADP-dependent oxidoreductase domain-containing protein n=1 Tax=uncultured Armatimonadetes bacterium TaxID=157466 RepID=A0A6J4JUU8_9BACT|nr:hypothetical protein AVDCRST_MAG63-4170 [uncultured Armatimonadetes bacterium]